MNPEHAHDVHTTITVGGERPYDVAIGRGLRFTFAEHLAPEVEKVLIIHPPTLATAASEVRESLRDDYEVILAEVPDGEESKRVEVASFCWQILGQSDFTRTDAIIGFGGGATTDLAGFVASTWLRGVDFIQAPTTLLGFVDASVGGKTGINTSEGKNLVGAFAAPRAVVADLDALTSLPREEIVAGFGEIVKYGFIAEPEILDIVEADPERALDPLTPEFERLIELSVGVKARVVAEDFTEQAGRAVLNYGHTLGHAIEHAERYRFRHGEAVSIGMVYAAELSRLSGRLSEPVVDRHRTVLSALGLPIDYPMSRWSGLLATMHRDKKARGSLLRFIVLDDLARPTVLAGPEPSLLVAAYQEIAR